MRKYYFRGMPLHGDKRAFVYGGFYEDDDCRCFILVNRGDGLPVDFVRVDRETVGVALGFFDKNEVEVYEGDVLKAHYFGFDGGSEIDKEAIGEIQYRPDGMCFVIAGKDRDILVQETTHFEEDCIEVIGNIHKNPELSTNPNTK